MITGELKNEVDKLWEAFWTGGVTNPLSVIEQITYLMFIRRIDELEIQKEEEANLLGITSDIKTFSADEQELRWNSFKHKTPEEMFELFSKRNGIFDHMKNVGGENGVFAEYMKNATFIIPTARLLDMVVQMLDKIKVTEGDTKGDLYEYLLSKLKTAGTNGQFRTPRHIIKMMVEMMQPTKEDIICDPAMGTAGFLVAAGEYITENHADWFTNSEFTEHFNNTMFNGMEFDATMLRIAAMNLILHDIKYPNLQSKDSLSQANAGIQNEFTLILANPPFKGSLDYDAVEKSLLSTVKTKKTELLFLALMLKMLKLGGRTAVIVPDGVLFGSSNAHKSIREEIINNNKLDAVISMPSGVFKPYAGVSTAILVFTKTGTGGTDNVWFYDMTADGYTLDDKRAKTDKNDIPDIVQRFLNRKNTHSGNAHSGNAHSGNIRNEFRDTDRTEKSFLVPFAEIKENDWDLSINRYKEIIYEEIKYDPPKEIIADIKNLDTQRTKLIEKLEGMLA